MDDLERHGILTPSTSISRTFLGWDPCRGPTSRVCVLKTDQSSDLTSVRLVPELGQGLHPVRDR